MSRQTLHAWLTRYEAQGLEGLADRSHRPVLCPHQMLAQVEAVALELRRPRPYYGPRRLVFELAKRRVAPVPSASAVCRALLRAGLIDPTVRDRRYRKWQHWERGAVRTDPDEDQQCCPIHALSPFDGHPIRRV